MRTGEKSERKTPFRSSALSLCRPARYKWELRTPRKEKKHISQLPKKSTALVTFLFLPLFASTLSSIQLSLCLSCTITQSHPKKIVSQAHNMIFDQSASFVLPQNDKISSSLSCLSCMEGFYALSQHKSCCCSQLARKWGIIVYCHRVEEPKRTNFFSPRPFRRSARERERKFVRVTEYIRVHNIYLQRGLCWCGLMLCGDVACRMVFCGACRESYAERSWKEIIKPEISIKLTVEPSTHIKINFHPSWRAMYASWRMDAYDN